MSRAPSDSDDLVPLSALAARFAALMPKRPVIVDLGSGSGATFRRLAPVIGRAQAWLFVENDDTQLGLGLDATARWAEAQGWTVTWPGRALLLHRPQGAWRIEGLVADIARGPPAQIRQANGVVTSALLERAAESWIGRLAPMLHVPLLACGLVDGRVAWLPRDPADAQVTRLWRRSLARNPAFGPGLGANAAAIVRRALGERGFAITTAATEWIVPARSPLSLPLVRRIASDARGIAGPAAARVNDWETRRGRSAILGRLGARVGHLDLLATPAVRARA